LENIAHHAYLASKSYQDLHLDKVNQPSLLVHCETTPIAMSNLCAAVAVVTVEVDLVSAFFTFFDFWHLE
jgi:hypothetical protein